jgi:hypothetical protein
VLGLFAMLDGRRAKAAAQALAGLLDSRRLPPAPEVLVRWADSSSTDSASPGKEGKHGPSRMHVVGISLSRRAVIHRRRR